MFFSPFEKRVNGTLAGRRARAPPGKDGQGDGGTGKAGQGDGGLGLGRGIVPARDFFYLIPVVLRVDFSKPQGLFCKKKGKDKD